MRLRETGGTGKDWRQGDFDGDEDVDFGDYAYIATNYTGTGGDYTQGGEAASGGGGEGGLIVEMLARGYTVPAWLYDHWLAQVYELQPSWLDELERILTETDSSDDGPSAVAVDKLLELLALESA